MAKKITLSVVITVLNEGEHILALLAALDSQTYQADEVIIVDGGSRDKTVELLEQWQKKHHLPVQVYLKTGNRSVGRNEGVQRATSHWIAFTDAGCVPHQNWLKKLVEKIKDNNAETVVAGYYDAVTKTGFEQAVVPYVLVMPDRVNPDTFLPATRSMLISKKLFTQLGGFDETLSDNEDYAFAKKLEHLRDQHQLTIRFAPDAKVSWLPRRTLRSFTWMIYRFARGDIQAGIVRPKVMALFGRYLGLLLMMGWLLSQNKLSWAVIMITSGLMLYTIWSIQKNWRYVPQGWYWLPVLQLAADGAVMMGSVAGWLRRRGS
ncbi:MAG TPA: glycosyltransferase [Vitreimonas sp.]|nr:glycosyltransferase [Vitreimonas sp.]